MTDERPSPPRAYLTFTDSAGVQWLVWKVAEASVTQIRGISGAPESPSLGKAWLVFLATQSGETRRITPVPKSWRKLSPAELETLLSEAKPFTRRS